MRTLPIALPQCGEPATTRIEIYSADSLDANAYTCQMHAEAAIAAVERAGRSASPITMAPGVQRPCGYVHVYPTGRLAEPEDGPAHPPWCDHKNCDQRGRHQSVRLPVSTGRPEAVIADLALTEALSAGVDPMIALTVVDGDSGREIVLSLGQSRVLSYQIRRLLDLSNGHRGNRRPSW
ncbi:hypothetical protein [Micromonospora aurantiaca (nom. illeg.)]|uniref:hypothetical protein n=1 Tax=Micromonospora aurantiaca (nom. illeg.) TaxID=47850 RepID=UPI00119D9376|nr:hypothetical protein [Micromonospora aurantiaca]MBC9006414.1 hypothetical protein [Micromonospora aurantiaca]